MVVLLETDQLHHCSSLFSFILSNACMSLQKKKPVPTCACNHVRITKEVTFLDENMINANTCGTMSNWVGVEATAFLPEIAVCVCQKVVRLLPENGSARMGGLQPPHSITPIDKPVYSVHSGYWFNADWHAFFCFQFHATSLSQNVSIWNIGLISHTFVCV